MPTCTYQKFFFLILLLSLKTICGLSQTGSPGNNGPVSLGEQLNAIYNISHLPKYLSNTTVAQISTYDTTGGNNDGFNGTYSFIRKDKDSNLVIFDIKGAGVINRIWTPTPGSDTLDFYIDDTTVPAFSIKYMDLFSNKIYPFVNPLCGNELGGYYCYLPIPFQTHCKIVCRARQTQFHQIQYRLYPAGTIVKKFSLDLQDREKSALKKIAALWNNGAHRIDDFYSNNTKVITSSSTIQLLPGGSATIFDMRQGGRILGLNIYDNGEFESLQNVIDIKITWDDEHVPAVYCPVADFFGYAFGKASMRSLLLGSKKHNNYAYFPMPFDKMAKIELLYRKTTSGDPKPVAIKAVINYTSQKRDASSEGKFYTCWKSNKLPSYAPAHIFLHTTGRGHYVGSMLLAQGTQPGMTYFFEGDDSTATDQVFRMHGTGSEDYFNGGWYAFPDKWFRKMSLPLHGALDYSLPFCRTGGYRFFLGDKISFEKDIYQSIEHGPEKNNIAVRYTSLAFYYCDRAPSGFVKPSTELSAVYLPDTMIMYPQAMNFNVWDNISCKASWLYNTGGQSFNFFASDESRLKISLDEIPDATYRLFADVTNTGKGCSFSLWQGQTQISEWIATTAKEKEERIPMQYMGKITLDDFSRSLTVQFKTSATSNSLLLSRLIFVREK